MPTGSGNPLGTEFTRWCLKYYFGRNNKEKQMTDREITVNNDAFEIKETVVTTGYVDENGKFVPTDGQPAAYIQDGEHVI